MPTASPRDDYWFVGPSEGWVCTPRKYLCMIMYVRASNPCVSGQAAVQIETANKWEPIHKTSIEAGD